MSGEDVTLSVVIVSYNTRAMTLECLRTLRADLGGLVAEVWVVDNASTDGTVAAIRETFPDVKVIANDRNAGFGAANNQALAVAAGKYVLLLNSDAFPRQGAVATLVRFLDENPRVGVVGPRLVNADGSLQVSCFPFPTPVRAWVENLWISRLFPHTARMGDYRRWAHDSVRSVDWIVGACLMVRRSAYDRVGGFDERFFMYAEESDWQRRMRDAGWEVAFTPDAVVTHLGGASGAAEKPRVNEHFFKSLDAYELKHHGIGGLVSLRAAMVVGGTLRLIVWSVLLVARPPRRDLAAAKVRLHSWLLARQTGARRLVARRPA